MSDTARNIRLPDDPCGKHFASAAIVAGVWRESVAGEVNTVSGEPAFDRILGLPAPSAEEVARNKKVVARLADEVPDTGSDRWASGWCRITINQCHCSFRAALEFLREGGDAADHKAEMAGWLTEWSRASCAGRRSCGRATPTLSGARTQSARGAPERSASSSRQNRHWWKPF